MICKEKMISKENNKTWELQIECLNENTKFKIGEKLES